MPVTSRLLEKASGAPNSGVGSRSLPDTDIRLYSGYKLNNPTSSLYWTASSVSDTNQYYITYSLNPTNSLNTDTYYYNSNVGFNIGTRLFRNIAGNYNNPTDPTTGNWIYIDNSKTVNVLTISSSVVSSISRSIDIP
jgi:hypothetical protein